MEKWLGKGLELAFRGHGFQAYFYTDWHSGLALVVFYTKEEDVYRVDGTQWVEAEK